MAAVVCGVLSVLFLVFMGSREDLAAKAQTTAAWSRVVPLIRHGTLPSVLPGGEGEAFRWWTGRAGWSRRLGG